MRAKNRPYNETFCYLRKHSGSGGSISSDGRIASSHASYNLLGFLSICNFQPCKNILFEGEGEVAMSDESPDVEIVFEGQKMWFTSWVTLMVSLSSDDGARLCLLVDKYSASDDPNSFQSLVDAYAREDRP